MNEVGRAALPLHVETRGEGPPVLLVHGYGASGHSFRHWVPGLERDHRLILVDLKGFGSAPKPRDGRYAPADLAAPLVDLILGMDLGNLTLVGHSLGGGVILLAALGLLDAGELGRVRGLVSISGAAYPQPLPPFAVLAGWPRTASAALASVPSPWLVRRILAAIVYEPARLDDEQIRGYAAPLRGAAARYALLAVARQIVPPDLDAVTARYRELDVPALLLWGRHDPVVPLAVAERLVKALPRARLVVLERCGHLPAEERPRESLRVLRTFIRSVGPPPSTPPLHG